MNEPQFGLSTSSNPFSLQPGAKKLKSEFWKIMFAVLAMAATFYFSLLRDIDFLRLNAVDLLAVGVFIVILLYLLNEMQNKSYWYNEFGAGKAYRYGPSPVWYSFDELQQVMIHQKGGLGATMLRRDQRNQIPPPKKRGKIQLKFATGRLTITPSYYQPEQVSELLQHVLAKVPKDYLPEELQADKKK